MTKSKVVKKRVRPTNIVLDPVESTIIVHFEAQIVDVSNPEKTLLIEKKTGQKRIRLKIKDGADLNKLTSEIINKCKYILPSKFEIVKGLLKELSERSSSGKNSAKGSTPRLDVSTGKTTPELKEAFTNVNENRARSDDIQVRKPRPTTARRPATARRGTSRPTNAQLSQSVLHDEGLAQEIEKQRKADIARQLQEQRNAETTKKLHEQLELERQRNAELKELQEERKTQQRLKELEGELEREREMRRKREKEEELKQQLDLEKEKEHAVNGAKLKAEEEELRRLAEEEDKVKQADQRRKEEEAKKREKEEKRRRKKKLKKFQKELHKNIPKEKAVLENIDKYLDYLYEDKITSKIKGTYLILQLVQQEPYNVEYFLENETLIGALGRILQEDRKKSTELVTNILEIFFCFSNFSQLHNILIQNKIGDTCLRQINLENKRYDVRVAEMNKSKDRDADLKLTRFLKRQEKLLYVCFYILLNLAEDINLEIKMVNRNITGLLLKLLDRTNVDHRLLDELHVLAVTFFQKLVAHRENLEKMRDGGIMMKLKNLMASKNDHLQIAVFQLLYRCTFSADMREQTSHFGMLPVLAKALHQPHNQLIVLKILYNMSVEDRYKSQIAFTGAVNYVTSLCCKCQERMLPDWLIALAINLSTSQRSGEQMATPDVIHQLVKRCHGTSDPLCAKLLHNISTLGDDVQVMLKKYTHELIGMAIHSESHDFLVEILGTIGNIALTGMRFAETMANTNIIEYLTKLLVPGFAEDDIILAVVICIGTFATDPNTAPFLADQRLCHMLNKLFVEKIDDEEIALQLSYTLFKLLMHEPTRKSILATPNFIDAIFALADDQNSKIKQLTNYSLDIVAECGLSDDLAERVRECRFEIHNRTWLTAVTDAQSKGGLTEKFHKDDLAEAPRINGVHYPDLRLSSSESENY